jgi:pSer/pThr/pTyr-binding forkhead associated (FHA) protein
MPAITITLDGVALRDIPLTKARTTLGRRPYNDIVMDHLAVSGEHAVFVLHPDGVELLDLHSTNGTYVNGKAVVSARVTANDLIEIGRYQIRLHAPAAVANVVHAPSSPPAAPPPAATPTAQQTALGGASIEVLNGPAAGKEMPLTKVVTTLGKPGIAVAAITHRGSGYTFALVDGEQSPLINGSPIGREPVALQHQDVLELAGTQMRFLIH